MAIVKHGTTKQVDRLINYITKKAEYSFGVDTIPEVSKNQFKAIRNLYNKTGGIQAHHVIWSFAPGESPSLENLESMGVKFAKGIAPGHEAVVSVHNDNELTHMHFAFNSVNYETGYKLNFHGREALQRMRDLGDEICKEYGLSVIDPSKSRNDLRYTLAEQEIMKKGEVSWKMEIRSAIENSNATNFDELAKDLKETHNIEFYTRGKNIGFIHPNGKKVRGKTLGDRYSKEGLKDVLHEKEIRGVSQYALELGEQSASRGDFEKRQGDIRSKGQNIRARADNLYSEDRAEKHRIQLAEAERYRLEEERKLAELKGKESEAKRGEDQKVRRRSRDFEIEL